MNDGQLLCRYVRDGDDPAFRELVHRHLDMVHATAARRLGDPHAAEDVSQAVFCLLVRKAAGLFDVADLGGWLHRAACWKASEHERAERRRRIREQASATPGELMMPPSPDDVWNELAPVLDATLDRLDDADRQLILWRFYRRRSLKEIGSDLKLSEDAARMRVNRAVERLRRLLAPSVGAAWAGAASATRAGSSLEELLAERAAVPAPNELAARVIAAASKVVTEPQGPWGEAVRAWVAHLGWRQAGIGLGAALGVALTVWRLAHPGAESQPAAGAAPTPPAVSTPPAVAPTESSPRRNLLASTRTPGDGTSPDETSELEARLAPLWRILQSTVPDRTHPPQDLRDCIAGLADRPEAVLDALSWAIADPTSSLDTRERAVWGLWLLGEATPALHSRIVAIAADLIAGERGPMRWHASEVLRHLGTPEGAVGAVAVALQSRPDAWEATKTFWESAANRRPNEVREVVGPWLRRDDVLRFLAAAVLARLPDAKSAELAPILLEGVPDGARQDVALRGLSALGPSAREFAPRLAEMLAAADRPGSYSLRDRLVEVLAEVAPESRKDWPQVDRYLEEKEAVESFDRKLSSNTPTLEDLVGGLKRNKTAWKAALQLESWGPKAADALPALREALAAPDCEHAYYLSKAIKAIDPSSPKPLFERDDLLPVLRSLSETSEELAAEIPSKDREAVSQFIEDAGSLTPERLAEKAEALGAIDPRLRRAWVNGLIRVDPALAGRLQR